MSHERELLFKIFNYLILNRTKNYFIELMYREFKSDIQLTLNIDKMKEEEKEECKHTSIEEIQGGQIEICRKCGKTWGSN